MKRIVVIFLFGVVFSGMAFSQTQEGRGTWYETDSKGLAASHSNLPFGTRVRVTNLQNDRQVIVTINNRIVDTPNRIIDISKAAADNLEMNARGTTPVRIEVLSRRRPAAEPETPPPTQTVEVPPPEPVPEPAPPPEPVPPPPPPQLVEEPEEEPFIATPAPVRQPQPAEPSGQGMGGNVTQTIITINGIPYAPSDSGTTLSASPSPSVTAPAPSVVSPAPAVVSPNPAVVSPNPAVIAPSPVTVSPSPAVISPAPAIISPIVVPPIVAQPVLAQPVLAPPVLAPPVVSPPIVSEPIVSQPIVSPALVSPTVTADPVISTPTQVQPMVSSAQTLTPQMMPAQTLPTQTLQAPAQQGGQAARILPRMPSPGSPGVYAVQVGAFMSEQNAAEAYRRVAETGLRPSYERYGDYIRVVVSGVRAADLEVIASRLGSANFREVLIREIR